MRRAALLLALAIATAGAGAANAQFPMTEPAPPARIAFTANEDVYTISADGSDRRRLTTMTDGTASFEPAFSPDGGSIVFIRELPVDPDLDEEGSQVWVMRADGGDQRPYAPAAPAGGFDASPAWSPDGAAVAFVRRRFARGRIVTELLVTGPGGSGLRTVTRIETKGSTFLSSPAWSPDGATILYTRTKLDDEGTFRPSLYSIPAAGGEPRRLASDSSDAAWSPDGQRIAFASVRDRNGQRCGSDECAYAGEIYVMNADGTGAARVTNDPGDERAPDWSGDGRRIAFQSDRNYPDGEEPELYSIEPDGACLTWLTNGTAASTGPDWQPGPGATDPGGCGPVPREPLIETDTRPAKRGKVPVYWLGTGSGDGLILSQVFGDGSEVFLDYDDCGRFSPSDCAPPVSLSNTPSCGSHVLFGAGYHPEAVTRTGDGGLLYTDPVEEGTPQLYAGSTTVSIYTDSRSVEPIVGALRRFGSESEPGRFPLALLPQHFWRRIERAAAARRKYGTAGAARRLKTSRGAVKERVAIHRRLKELGPLGRIDCSP